MSSPLKVYDEEQCSTILQLVESWISYGGLVIFFGCLWGRTFGSLSALSMNKHCLILQLCSASRSGMEHVHIQAWGTQVGSAMVRICAHRCPCICEDQITPLRSLLHCCDGPMWLAPHDLNWEQWIYRLTLLWFRMHLWWIVPYNDGLIIYCSMLWPRDVVCAVIAIPVLACRKAEPQLLTLACRRESEHTCTCLLC